MRLVRKLLALPRSERRLLVQAALLLTVIRLGLGRLPFPFLRRLATGGGLPAGGTTVGDPRLEDRVVWAVTVASRYVPGAMCLSRALSVHSLLARHGSPSRLHIGVVRGGHGKLEGHAWVESDKRVLIGGTASEVGHFTPIAAFDADAGSREPTAGALRGGR